MKTILLLVLMSLCQAETIDYTKMYTRDLLLMDDDKMVFREYEVNDRARSGKDLDVIITVMRDKTIAAKYNYLAMRSLEGTGNVDMLYFAISLIGSKNETARNQGYFSIVNNGHKDWKKFITPEVLKQAELDKTSKNGNLSNGCAGFLDAYNKP